MMLHAAGAIALAVQPAWWPWVLGVLAFSKVPVLNAIGSSVGIGAILSLVFSAILITRAQDQQ